MTTAPPPAEAGPEDPPQARPFSVFLQEHANGSTLAELTEALQALSRAVRETGKKGSLTLVVEVDVVKKGVNDTLAVRDRVVLKAPTLDRRVSIFYPDERGNLLRSDPNQLRIEGLRVIETPTVAVDELRSVDGKTAAAGRDA